MVVEGRETCLGGLPIDDRVVTVMSDLFHKLALIYYFARDTSGSNMY